MAVTVQPAQRSFPVATHRPAVRSGWLTLSLVAAVLVLALGLRLSGVAWGLPWVFHPDEVHYVGPAETVVKSGDPNPRYFQNPSLLTYLLAAELLVTRAVGPLAGPFAADAPGSAHLLARLNSALIGGASVAVLFALGTTLFNRWVGLVAALLLAVSFLHVRDSHYGVNDVPGTGLLLVSVYCSARLLREPRLRWYVLAGISGGLATSTKYNMGFFFAPLLAAHFLAPGGAVARFGRGRLLARPGALLAAAAASLAAYLAATPYTVLDFRRFSEDFLTQYRFGDSRWLGQPLEPIPLLYVTTLLQGFGVVAMALVLLGLALVWRQRPASGVLILAFPAVYLAFLVPKVLFFPRFAVPLLPFCSLLAAYGASQVITHLKPSWRRLGATVLLAAALAQPLVNDLQHNRLLFQTDTRVLANEWVQANLPPGSRLKVESYSLIDRSVDGRIYTPNTAQLRIEPYLSTPDDQQLRYFLQQEVHYFVTSSFHYERLFPDGSRRPDSARAYQRLHRDLEERAELVASFSPGWDGEEVPYRSEDVMTPFWSLGDYERLGPTVRVYSLAPLAAGRR